MNRSYHPRYWIIWFLLLVLRLLTLLPFPLQLAIGRGAGRLGQRLFKKRKAIAEINLKLAFPSYSQQQIAQLLTKHFESLGMSLFETALGWWGSRSKLESFIKISGLEHLDHALERGNGVLLFSAHFTTLDLSGIMLATKRPVHAVYRPNKNPVINQTIQQGRERILASTIPKNNIREMVKKLKGNGIVWYAMDQNFDHKGSIFSNFFGIPAATNTATSRLAKMTGTTIIPFFAHRDNNGCIYRLNLLPPLTVDGSHIQEETDQLNQLIETAVRSNPEQYLWIHRRFKSQPPNQPNYYG
ncbi:MAG: LpxL/LpxP family Kdo(2)-lipid IV(A) lauroyl/palmitoleoyl acyltransferase [Gammaproteobacteria bacterium]|jgi:KDO2-lipid IV(A) lauroyltransferase|nr:LpxL/LpxP family Kdo(2)-lipid IV(A) lauroyl/palmitoleoyl acyltransferase [Gammaproteobacteria bacterium]MBT4606976.1 LpxL/LpxP family Kdo(2)-lipid IV(A) lauroyl/palmitoleoyl acyltransferase [Thiotrichales bacterium]MBT5465344.1 LpxL/LpxP family Kdo(2)-lipid IV(A) lauroyl/palmitoleoyl acyltransferase [Candidatus Neomarinimicrobiota bacterium]MBT3968115.1 LpxL/LpxP family Kdo(2)-lipid IV(A) lauroyl/palmitoleoyl acyltransferase [Gammaproteobacteria bacterium]MBT4081181.1 LpxL/LpxP family Kdo(2)